MTTEPFHDDPLLDRLDRLPESAFDRAAASPAFRDMLLRRTTAALYQRRRHRRALTCGACLLTYAAGLATAYFALGPQPAEAPHVVQSEVSTPEPPPAAPALVDLAPWELEQRAALADAAQRPELLRVAGDRYFNDYADVQSALRCYRQLLDLVPSDQRTFDPSDNYLLTSLKQARRSEAPHANTGT